MVPPIFNPRAAGQTAGAVWIAHRAIVYTTRAQERKRPRKRHLLSKPWGTGIIPAQRGRPQKRSGLHIVQSLYHTGVLIWNIPYYAN